MEAPLWLRLHAAAVRSDDAEIDRWNDEMLAARETAELRAESLQMGSSMLRVYSALGLVAPALSAPTYTAAFAVACARLGIAARDGLAAYLWAWLENQVLVAVKTVPLGQQAGQAMLFALHPHIGNAIETAVAARRRRHGHGHRRPCSAVGAPRDAVLETVPLLRIARMTSTDFAARSIQDRANGPLRVGVGGPVGSGKTTLVEMLCKRMRDRYRLAVITNDIYTKEDERLLVTAQALTADRIIGVETGGCPHTAIREDASINLEAVDRMCRRFPDLQIIFIESGGDNLAATFSPELSDLTLYVIDVAGGEKIPRKGGPGITKSDLLVINKTDLAPHVGANLDVMRHDTERMRGPRPYVMTNLKTRRRPRRGRSHFIERQGLLQGEPSLLAQATGHR